MDKLEQYLDQVCRGIGGPRSLRQHVRQELREHLRDAAAEHKAAGMSEAEALDRALADFGGPEAVRAELEATHGHRLLPVVIDTAMHWKEKTLKAKWLWTTWTYIAAVGVIALEVMSLSFCNVFLVPKLKKLQSDGWVNVSDVPALTRLNTVLNGLQWAGEYFTWILILVAAVWGLFEWRVRSENKPFMRLAALGTAAAVLAAAFFLCAAALIIPFEAGLPASSIVRPFAVEAVVRVETAVAALEQAQAKKDWEAMQEPANHAVQAITRLDFGPSLQSLTTRPPPSLYELRPLHLSAREALGDVQLAVKDKDAARLDAALKRFHDAFNPIQQAAKKPEKQ